MNVRKRLLFLVVFALCVGCDDLSPNNVTKAPTPSLHTIGSRFEASDDWIEHVTIITDTRGGNEEYACFFGRFFVQSRAMSCVRLGTARP